MGTRSVIPWLPVAAAKAPFKWTDPYNDIIGVCVNRNFRISIGSSLAFGMSTGAYATLSLYLATYFWELSVAQLAGFGSYRHCYTGCLYGVGTLRSTF